MLEFQLFPSAKQVLDHKALVCGLEDSRGAIHDASPSASGRIPVPLLDRLDASALDGAAEEFDKIKAALGRNDDGVSGAAAR